MWKAFWQDLNIRKCVTLLMAIGYIVILTAIVFYALNKSNNDLLMYVVTGLTSTLTMCIGYYFGYTTKGSETPSIKNTES